MGSRAVSKGLIELGERIREKRLELHLTQEGLAEMVGVSANTIIRAEGGQSAMSIEVFAKIVKALGADAGELLGEQIMGIEGKKQMDALFLRVSHLRKSDQEIVLQTIGALLDGLYRHRYGR